MASEKSKLYHEKLGALIKEAEADGIIIEPFWHRTPYYEAAVISVREATPGALEGSVETPKEVSDAVEEQLKA